MIEIQLGHLSFLDTLKDPKNGPPPQPKPMTTLGKLEALNLKPSTASFRSLGCCVAEYNSFGAHSLHYDPRSLAIQVLNTHTGP